jgi:polysaccharide pyruvyl transferase WcaK-like protein
MLGSGGFDFAIAAPMSVRAETVPELTVSNTKSHMITRREFFAQTTALGLVTAIQAAEPKGKTILLRSAWDTVNIGDIAITPGTLRILEKHLPEARVVLWAAKMNERIETMLKRRFPGLEIITTGYRAVDPRNGPRDPALRASFEEADLVIQNSGMIPDTEAMVWSRKLGKKYGLYGQSYFPSMVEGKPDHVALLSGASFLYARDSHTLALLKAHGVTAPIMEFAPDGCFGNDVRDEERALAFLREHDLRERQFITVMLRTNTPKHPERVTRGTLDPNGLAGTPTPEMAAQDERRAAVYREVMTRWARRTGMKILIAPEVEKEIGHNKRLLFDPLPDDVKARVVRRATFWNSDEATSVFARARIVFCHEPHSPIMALAVGTPIVHTFSVEHGPKAWMFADIGLPEWLMDFEQSDADRMLAALLDIHEHYDEALLKVRKAMNLVERKWDETTTVMRGALNS